MFGIPVEFVPEGVSAEDARRAARNRKAGKAQIVSGLLALLALIGMFGGAGWWGYSTFLAEDQPPKKQQAKSIPVEPVQKPTKETVRVSVSSVITYTATPNPNFQRSAKRIISLSPLPIPTGIPTESQIDLPFGLNLTSAQIEQIPQALEFIRSTQLTRTMVLTQALDLVLSTTVTDVIALVDAINSPVDISLPPPTLTQTITITKTPVYTLPYRVYANTHGSGLYSYISGWIVENDGITPRPILVILKFPTGQMTYPRPNHNDVATGYYEFLVSPGDYVLQIQGFTYPVKVSDTPTRYEISFEYTRSDRVENAAKSQPWNNPQSKAREQNTDGEPTVHATPIQKFKTYLPFIRR